MTVQLHFYKDITKKSFPSTGISFHNTLTCILFPWHLLQGFESLWPLIYSPWSLADLAALFSHRARTRAWPSLCLLKCEPKLLPGASSRAQACPITNSVLKRPRGCWMLIWILRFRKSRVGLIFSNRVVAVQLDSVSRKKKMLGLTKITRGPTNAWALVPFCIWYTLDRNLYFKDLSQNLMLQN